MKKFTLFLTFLFAFLMLTMSGASASVYYKGAHYGSRPCYYANSASYNLVGGCGNHAYGGSQYYGGYGGGYGGYYGGYGGGYGRYHGYGHYGYGRGYGWYGGFHYRPSYYRYNYPIYRHYWNMPYHYGSYGYGYRGYW